jgi:hypothetical protein
MLVIWLARRVTKSDFLAVLAGLLYAIDPLAIRHDVRSLMETLTMLLLLAGIALFIRFADQRPAKAWPWLLTGSVFSLAIVTKDVAAVFVSLMFIASMIFKAGPPLKAYAYMAAVVTVPYAIWLAIVAATGNGQAFLAEKLSGVQRFFGILQVTGFNTDGAPSKGGTLLQTIPQYASSYVIMGLALLGALLLARSKDRVLRRWGSVGLASAAVIAYLAAAGTFEEQFLYYLLPGIITVLAAGLELSRRVRGRWFKVVDIAASVLVAALLLFGVASYAINKRTPDDGWRTSVEWVEANVPAHSKICTFDQGQFLLSSDDYDICDWHTIGDLKRHDVRYVLVAEKAAKANLTLLDAKDLTDISHAGTKVFSYESRDSGTFSVFKIPQTTTSKGE